MKPYSLFLILFALGACGQFEDGQIKPPLVYRIDIQQGNVVTQAMLNKLKPGMDERQVKFIMGTPLLEDPFHPERWEYVYYEKTSGDDPQGRRITLYFEDQRLSHLTGNVKVTYLPVVTEENRNEKSVVVPAEYGQRGLFDKLLDRRPEINKKKKAKEEKEFSGALPDETEEALEDAAEDTVEEYTTEQAAVDGDSGLNDDDLLNAVESDLDITETDQEDLEQAEAPEKEEGFFSRMWDEVTGKNREFE